MATVPFTPRPTRQSGRYFTPRDLQRYATTIASVRGKPTDEILEELENSGDAAIRAQIDFAREHERRTTPGTSSTLARGERGESRAESRTDRTESRTDSRAESRATDRERERLRRERDRESRPGSSGSYRERDRDRERERDKERERHRADRGDRPRSDSLRHREHERERGKEKEREPQTRVTVEVEVDGHAVAGSSTAAPTRPSPPARLLEGVPLAVQEAWICEDLMFVLQGVEGELIRYAEGYDPLDVEQRLQGARWQVDPSLDPSLLSLVNRLLPIATFFTSVEASIELRNSQEYGMVGHALSAGIRGMLKEYRVLTAQLESLFLTSPTFTLQTLYFHLHPTLHTMSLLSSLCLALETDEKPDDDASDDEDDGLGGMAEELGLGGALGLMRNLKAQEGLINGGGLVVGGEVLGIICEREATMSGDPTATSLHSQLLLHASQPYARMLLRWISTGKLTDPYDEFMVKESGHITKGVLESDYTDEYWDRRYTLRDGSSLASSSKVQGAKAPSLGAAPNPRQGTNRLPGGACIPAFLQPWKHKILLAGKYLNVMRECGIDVRKDDEESGSDQPIVMNEPKFYKRIEDAYIYANRSLLKLLVEEQELIPHLRSLKHFFFADQSDFLTNFLDLAHSDLTKKSAKQVSIVKLQSLLDLAVRNPASSSSNDPYKDNLKVTMASQGLYDWLLKIVTHTSALEDGELDFALSEPAPQKEKEKELLGIDAVTFDYTVKFPLSLVISRKAITRYQLLFRFLVHLHHLESGLSGMWLEHKTALWKPTGNGDMDAWARRIFALRARMLAFVRHMLAYATGEVLESNWRSLESQLAKVQTVDQLMRDHVDFLDTCLKQCMLTNSKLLSVYSKLMHTISTFIAYHDRNFTAEMEAYKRDPVRGNDAGKVEHRWAQLKKFEVHFTHHTNLHLDAVTYNAGSENVALLALVTRLHQTTLRR